MLANTPSLARRLAGTVVALGLAAGGLALSLPASADPGAPASGTFKILRVAADGSASGVVQDGPKTEVKKEVRIVNVGTGDKLTDAKRAEIEALMKDRKCPDGAQAITAESGGQPNAEGKVEKSRIMICAKGGATKSESIEGLEKALARVQSDREMNPSINAEITAKLKARIAELKAN